MIERISVRGFQSLADVEIELGRFTVLVGPSNSGKSAIRRAIEALVRNDPPAGRLRNGETSYGVTMHVEDAVPVSIIKSAKATSYDVAGLIIDKPGATCPPAVRDLLQLDTVNFASQFDQPFLLADTPSAVARSLGELTNISVLFEGIREATRRQRAAGQKAKTLNEQVDALAAKLVTYSDLPVEKDRLDNAAAVMTQAHAADGHARRLQGDLALSQRHAELHTAALAEIAAQPDWDYVEGTLTAAETTMAEAAAWTGALDRATVLDRQRIAHVEPAPDIDVDPVAQAIDIASTLARAHTEAQKHRSAITQHATAMMLTQAEIDAEQELDTLDVCPLCDQPIGAR